MNLFPCLFLFILPIAGISQMNMDTIRVIPGKVSIVVPKTLSPISDEMYSFKYPNTKKPTMVISDADGTVNLIASVTSQPLEEARVISFKDMQLQTLKKARPDIEVLDDNVKVVDGRKVAFFKFLSKAVDQKVFNYIFITSVDGKALLFSFNCIQKLQKVWEPIADGIVLSLHFE